MKKFFESKIFRFIWSAGVAAILYLICPDCFSKTTLGILLVVLLVIVNAADFIAGKDTGLNAVSELMEKK